MAGKGPYNEWRTLVEQYGGSMHYEGRGSWGAWIIKVGQKQKRFNSTGSRAFPDLDQCYEPDPEITNPRTWDHFNGAFLKERAVRRLTEWFGEDLANVN